MLQASRGTVKASGNFNAGADAEVLYKAMKGLGKMTLVCVFTYAVSTVLSDTLNACQPVVFLQQTNERVLFGEFLSKQLL